MDRGQDTDSGNRYRQRLGLPMPDLDAALRHPEVKIAHLMALALLEAGGPLSLEAIAERLGRLALPPRLAAAGSPASLRRAWHGKSPLVRDPEDGRFYLDLLAHHDLRWVAYLADPLRAPATRSRPEGLQQQAEAERARVWRAEHAVLRADEENRKIDEARRARRALVHIIAVDGVPRGAAVIDAAAREQRLFIDEAMNELAAHLDAFDFLAGVDLRPSLRLVGLDPDRWWLAELRPTQRTLRPSDQGAVAVSLPAVVQATTGKSRVPADAKAWKPLLAGRSTTRLATRLEQEAQALFALYEYGALHGGVRIRRRPGDRLLPVSWSLAGDPDFESFVSASVRHWLPVEIVVGPSAELSDPWPGATTVTIVERDRDAFFVREGDDVRALDPSDIRAIRLPPGPATPAVGPRSWFRYDRRTCRLTVTLDEIQPPIWRRLDVPASVTLAKLHELLQAALGWTNSHLHVFEIGDERIAIPYDLDQLTEGDLTRSARLVQLGDVVDHGFRRFGYEYDFGDSWHHTIEIEEVRDEADGDGWARCLGGARACPPEDCGGTGGYARLLEILFDPRHPEFEETRVWARRFEPERFDLGSVNAALAAVGW